MPALEDRRGRGGVEFVNVQDPASPTKQSTTKSPRNDKNKKKKKKKKVRKGKKTERESFRQKASSVTKEAGTTSSTLTASTRPASNSTGNNNGLSEYQLSMRMESYSEFQHPVRSVRSRRQLHGGHGDSTTNSNRGGRMKPELQAALNLQSILESMKLCEDNPVLQEKGCRGISTILRTLIKRQEQEWVDRHMVDGTVRRRRKTMGLFSALSKEELAKLTNIAEEDEDGTGTVTSMENSTHRGGCLSCEDGDEPCQLEDRILETVLGSMMRHYYHSKIQLAGCRIITILAQADMMEVIVGWGGLILLEAALFHGIDSAPEVVLSSLQALHTMIVVKKQHEERWSSEMELDLVETDLLNTIVVIIQHYPNHRDIQRLGKAVIKRLSSKLTFVHKGTKNRLRGMQRHNSLDDGMSDASSTFGDSMRQVASLLVADAHDREGEYSGEILEDTGLPHGTGHMVYEDGKIYEGSWRFGYRHGKGSEQFSNGDTYTGMYDCDLRHGHGVYGWADGRVYKGEFDSGKRHGWGIFKWPDGAVYDGYFVDGRLEGYGVYTFVSNGGGYYDGNWKAGKYHGYGTCTWEDGRQYCGQWKYGMAHGQGVEINPDGTIFHDGDWSDDKPVVH